MRIEKRFKEEDFTFSIYDDNYREIILVFYNFNNRILKSGMAFEKTIDDLFTNILTFEQEFNWKCSPILEITDDDLQQIEKYMYEQI